MKSLCKEDNHKQLDVNKKLRFISNSIARNKEKMSILVPVVVSEVRNYHEIIPWIENKLVCMRTVLVWLWALSSILVEPRWLCCFE